LEGSFLKEAKLPRPEGWGNSIKNEVVSLLPYLPRANNEEFHEEIAVE
jgi:hypothetical protein